MSGQKGRGESTIERGGGGWEGGGGKAFVCVSRESNIIKGEAVQWKQSGSSGGSGADSGSRQGGAAADT